MHDASSAGGARERDRAVRRRTVGDMAVMPMFPLGSVLLPGSVLPLHVFEPRYRQLVIDCLADDTGDPEFGVTLIERGSEVGGGDQRTDVGVVARMVQVEALEGGRYALVAVGTRRIRVNAWLPDDPYPVADVDDWPDEDPDAAGLADRVDRVEGTSRGGARARRRARRCPSQRRRPVRHRRRPARRQLPPRRCLAARARRSVPPALRTPSPATRLDLLAGSLDDIEAMLRFRLTPDS